MITVLRIPLSKDKLRALSKEERALFFLLGYASNQITMFQKLVTFATNKTPSDPVEQKVTGAHTQMMARFMIGVLNEAWQVINKRFIGRPIGREYLTLLDSGGQEVLAGLKRHFGGSNLLTTIRNDFAYHHPDDDDVDAAFHTVANDPQWNDDWNWYLSHSTFNTFYFECDLVILHGLLHASEEADLIAAQKKIMAEVRLVADLINQFIPAFAAAVWRKHFGPTMDGEVSLLKGDAPSVWEPWIPFFVEMSDPPPMDQQS